MRGLLVGKQIKFDVHSTSNNVEVGAVTLPDAAGDLALAVVKAGWASVREIPSKSNGSEPTEEAARRTVLLEAMEGAKQAKVGIWGEEKLKTVAYSMPEDPVDFLSRHKGVAMDAIIEACPNGSTVRCRLLMDGGVHQFVNLGLAGVRAPKSSHPSGDAGEEFGDEVSYVGRSLCVPVLTIAIRQAKFFLEARILQRQLKVTLLSLPSTPTQFGTSQAIASAPTLFLGTIAHPRGNVAAFLLADGLAKVVDWHAGFLSAIPGAMVELRTAESGAKAARKGVWKDLPVPTAGAVAKAKELEKERKWDGVVTRVWGADMLSVLPAGSNVERKLQLSSIRQPRLVPSLVAPRFTTDDFPQSQRCEIRWTANRRERIVAKEIDRKDCARLYRLRQARRGAVRVEGMCYPATGQRSVRPALSFPVSTLTCFLSQERI